MSNMVSEFRRAVSIESGNGFDSQMESNEDSTKRINELADSYQAFIQGRYGEAAEVLTRLIDQYEANITESSALSRLYFLRSECESRFGQLKNAYDDGRKAAQVNEDVNAQILNRRLSVISISLLDNADMELVIDGKKWNITASQSARNTINPIRRIVDRCKVMPNTEKPMISLSIGDPTTYGNMLPPAEAIQAVNEAFAKPSAHGYVPSCGTDDARDAVAKLWSRDNFKLDSRDIILTSGCSHALEMCFNCVADANDNILIPQPGFSLYLTLCHSLNIEPRFYKLIPDQNWEIDLDDLEAAINENTKAVVVNNPSNPCGAVYNAEHLQKIIDLCEKHCLPIIADEIYADMVFGDNKFHFMGPMSKNVPILSCGGLAKRYICPGWRVGWIIMYDRNNVFKESIRPGLLDLSSRILGPNSVIQAALPQILSNTPQKYFDDIMTQIETNASLFCEILTTAPGLKPIMPQGTMYMLVGIDSTVYDDIESDVEFFTKLFNEQSVSCLPASVFGAPNFFRLILTAPPEKIREACNRIVEFCLEHEKSANVNKLRRMKSVTIAVGDEGLLRQEESILPFHTKSIKFN